MKTYGQDSVFSWIVAVSCLWIYTVIYGLVRLSGVLLVASMPRYNVGREAASFPYTLVNFTKNIGGPLVGLLAQRFGIRPVIVIGVLLATVGVATCFVAENILVVAILWGIVFGAGSAACIVLLPVLINYNFNKYRSIASGLSKMGLPLGSFIMPLITDALLHRYELSGSFLLLSGFVLNCLPAALFLRCPNSEAKNLKFAETPFYDGEKQRLISKEKSVHDTTKNYNRILSSNTKSSNLAFEKSPQKQYKAFNMTYTLTNSQYLEKALYHKRKMSWHASNQVPIDYRQHQKLTSSLDATRNSNITTNVISDACFNGNEIPNNIAFQGQNKNQPKNIEDSALNLNSSKDYQVVTTHTSKTLGKEKNIDSSRKTNEISVEKIRYKNSGKSLNLICDPLFLIVVAVSPFTVFITTCIFAIVVDFSNDIGIAAEYGKYTVMAISGGEIFGHVVIGFMTDGRCLIRNTTFLVIGFLAQAISLMAVTWSTGFYILICTLAVFGCMSTIFSVLTPVVLGDFIPAEQQMLAIPSIALLGGPASLTVTPLIGYFREQIGSYVYLFYVCSVLSVLCGFLWLAAHFITNRREKYMRH